MGSFSPSRRRSDVSGVAGLLEFIIVRASNEVVFGAPVISADWPCSEIASNIAERPGRRCSVRNQLYFGTKLYRGSARRSSIGFMPV